MNVNKKYNRNKKEINYKYELLLKEILEHKDFSEILYEINGFADDKKWGVTERQNIVCLDENNYRIKIEFTEDATSDIKNENKTINIMKNNTNENTFESIRIKNKDKNKYCRKKISKSKNELSHRKDKKDKKTNKRKTSTNFHQYFSNNNFYDSSHMKSYICSCGKNVYAIVIANIVKEIVNVNFMIVIKNVIYIVIFVYVYMIQVNVNY